MNIIDINNLLFSNSLVTNCLVPTKKRKLIKTKIEPTAKQKEAYIIEKLSKEYDELEMAKNNTSIIRKDLEYLDNVISAEKYALQLQIKEL